MKKRGDYLLEGFPCTNRVLEICSSLCLSLMERPHASELVVSLEMVVFLAFTVHLSAKRGSSSWCCVASWHIICGLLPWRNCTTSDFGRGSAVLEGVCADFSATLRRSKP